MINFHICFVCCRLCLSFTVLYSSDCFGYFLSRSLLLSFCRGVVVLFLFRLLAARESMFFRQFFVPRVSFLLVRSCFTWFGHPPLESWCVPVLVLFATLSRCLFVTFSASCSQQPIVGHSFVHPHRCLFGRCRFCSAWFVTDFCTYITAQYVPSFVDPFRYIIFVLLRRSCSVSCCLVTFSPAPVVVCYGILVLFCLLLCSVPHPTFL